MRVSERALRPVIFKAADDKDHPLGESSRLPSIIREPMISYHPKAWSSIDSSLFHGRKQREKETGSSFVEYQTQWTDADNASCVVHNFVKDVLPWFDFHDDGINNTRGDEQLEQDLISSMKAFRSFCHDHLDVSHYKMKLAIMPGGEKRCPAWHVDYVPVRWLQTLHGQGTLTIDPLQYPLDQPTLKRLSESTKGGINWKERAIKNDPDLKTQQAKEGEALLLIGKTWQAVTGQHRSAVFHRSPLDIPRHQFRILLGLDVVVKCSDSGCGCGS